MIQLIGRPKIKKAFSFSTSAPPLHKWFLLHLLQTVSEETSMYAILPERSQR